jgi:hypothetical protein
VFEEYYVSSFKKVLSYQNSFSWEKCLTSAKCKNATSDVQKYNHDLMGFFWQHWGLSSGFTLAGQALLLVEPLTSPCLMILRIFCSIVTYHFLGWLFCLFVFGVLGLEHRTSHLLHRCSTFFALVIFPYRVTCFLPGSHLRLLSVPLE